MSLDCVFCKIVSHELPSSVVFENDLFLAFRDIHPEAPTHVLVIPKKHIETMTALHENTLLFDLWKAAIAVAKHLGIDDNCKFVVNNGKSAGQIVPHVHIHILSQKAS